MCPSRVPRRVWLTVGIISNALVLPLTGVFVFFGLCSINPMTTAFLTEFEIRNESPETVRVTPVGVTEVKHERVLLPTYEEGWPNRFNFQQFRDVPVAPGGVLRVRYDWDDCVLSEVIVRRSSGELRKLTVHEYGARAATELRCPNDENVEISGIDRLPAPEPYVTAALDTRPPRWIPPLLLLAIGPAVHLMSATVLIARWQSRRREPPGGSHAQGAVAGQPTTS